MGRHDAKSLIWLRDQLGDRFHLGVVLYAGQFPFRIADRLWTLPIGSLWRQPDPLEKAQQPLGGEA